MRIGIDAREALRANPRGIGLYTRYLIEYLGQVSPDDEFLLYHERDLPADVPAVPANARPVQARIRGGRWHLWERVLMPWRQRRDRLAVYHGTYNTLPPRWPIGGPPMVVTIHDTIVTWLDENLDDPYVSYCRKVTRRVTRQAAAILTVSEWSRREISGRFDVPLERIEVIHNGIHDEFLAGPPEGAGERIRQRFTSGRPYLFAVGSSLDRKNTGRLLDALGDLNRQRPLEHAILISGLSADHQARFAARAAEAGISDHVRFLPYLDRTDLVAVYSGADLSIYPSRVEGWGFPIVESLSVGTPVVTSGTSGMLEAGGEHARYFDPDDFEDMVATLARALEDLDGLHRGSAAGIEWARQFSWRRTAELTRDVYRRVR